MLDALAAAAVDAFFDNGLLRASRILLEGAMGSFGLVLSTSLEADSELIVAARGQVPTPNPKCLSPNPNPSPNPSPTPTPTPPPAPTPSAYPCP